MSHTRLRSYPHPGAFFLAWILAWSGLSARGEETPSLPDTMDFIRRSLDEHGDFRNIGGGGRLQMKLGTVLGRRIRIQQIFSDGTPGGEEMKETTEFSFEDLDPDVTHVRLYFAGDRLTYAVWLGDSGRGGGIRVWGGGNEDLGAKNRPYGWLAVDSEALAQALVKALNHAIRLSGGKPRPSADGFFGAPSTVRLVPPSPVTDGVYHVVALEDAVMLLRRRMRDKVVEYPVVGPADLSKGSWPMSSLSGAPLLVTLPSDGLRFETNSLDAVRFEGSLAGKGRGLAVLLTETPYFISAGVASVREGSLPCNLIQLPLPAAQLPPLDQAVSGTLGVRLWTTIGAAWPDDEPGFLWLARSKSDSRDWRLAVQSMPRAKEFGPDSVKAAAAAFGLKPSKPLTDLLKARAKEERALRKAAR